MNTAARLLLVLLVAIIFSACSSQDFYVPAGRLTDLVDSGEPYVDTKDEEEQGRLRAQRIAEMLVAWEKSRRETPRDYIIGTDDVLEFSIMSLEEPGQQTVVAREVRKDGGITLPLAGDVMVGGRTVQAIEELVKKAYDTKYLKNPRLTVQVTEYRSQPVVITGAVTAPGVYYLRRNQSSVLEVIAQANGLTADAGGELVIVRGRKRRGGEGPAPGEPAPVEAPKKEPNEAPPREDPRPVTDAADDAAPLAPETGAPLLAGSGLELLAPEAAPENEPASDRPEAALAVPVDAEMISVNLQRLVEEGDMRLNATIKGGDIVSIPPRKKHFVYVLGYVQSPGAMDLGDIEQLSALKAVAMAGGLSHTARAQNSFVISERNGARTIVKVDLTKVVRGIRPDVSLRSGDTLIVGSDPIAKLAEFIRPTIGASASLAPIP